jgi:hypothetical protein
VFYTIRGKDMQGDQLDKSEWEIAESHALVEGRVGEESHPSFCQRESSISRDAEAWNKERQSLVALLAADTQQRLTNKQKISYDLQL